MDSHKVEIARICLGLGMSERQAVSYANLNRDTVRRHPEEFRNILPIASNRNQVYPIFKWLDRKQIKLNLNKKRLNFELPEDYLAFLYFSQNGKCFYTGQELSLSTSNKFASVSVDRVDTAKGYVEENLVLTSSRINMVKSDATFSEMKEWMPAWHSQIVDKFPSLNKDVYQKLQKYKTHLPQKDKLTFLSRAQYYEIEDYFTKSTKAIFKFDLAPVPCRGPQRKLLMPIA